MWRVEPDEGELRVSRFHTFIQLEVKVSTHLGPKTRFLLLLDCSGFVDVWPPLWRVDGSVVYNCCWASLANSFSGLSPAVLMTKFYCFRFETPPAWRVRPPYLYPPGTRWPIYTPRHGVPFWSSPTTRRNTVEVFEPASTRGYVTTHPIGKERRYELYRSLGGP
jgi:hypothetical protein